MQEEKLEEGDEGTEGRRDERVWGSDEEVRGREGSEGGREGRGCDRE